MNGTATVVFGASRPSPKPVTALPTSAPTFFPLPYQRNAPWPHFRGPTNDDAGQSLNTGAVKNTTYWNNNLGSPVYGTVAVAADGSTFIGTKAGAIYAFDITGFELWKYTANSGIYSSIAIGYDTTLYFTTIQGTLYALSQAGQGTPKWTFQAAVTASQFQTVSSPAITNFGIVYFGADKLYAVSTVKGSLVWSFDPSVGTAAGTNSYIASSPTVDSSGNVYFGSNNNAVYCISSLGSLNWKYTTGGSIVATPTVHNQAVYVGSGDGNFYAIGGGSLVWKFKTGGPILSSAGLAPGGGTIYFASTDNSTYSLNTLGGLNWKYTTGAAITSSVTVDYSGIIYFGSNDKLVYSLSPAAGSVIWRYHTKGAVSGSLSIGYPGMSYVGSSDGYIYCIGKLFATLSPGASSSSGSTAVDTSFVQPLVISFVVVFFMAIAALTYYVAFGCQYCKKRKFSMNDEQAMEGMETDDNFQPEVDEAVVRKFEEETNMPLSALTTFDVCQLLPNIDMAEYVINFRMKKVTGKMLYKIETIEQMSILGISIPPEKKQDFLTIIEFMRQRGVERKLLVDLPFDIPSPSKRPSIEMISSGEYYGNVAGKVAAMDGNGTGHSPDKVHNVGIHRTNSMSNNRNSTGKASVIGVSPPSSPRASDMDDPMAAYPGGNQSYSPTSPNAQGVYKTAAGVTYTKTGAKVKEEDAFCNVCNKKLPSASARECPHCRSMIIR